MSQTNTPIPATGANPLKAKVQAWLVAGGKQKLEAALAAAGHNNEKRHQAERVDLKALREPMTL